MFKYILSLVLILFFVSCGSSAAKDDSSNVVTEPTNTNQPPITQDDVVTIVANASAYVYPLANDSDPEDDNLTIKSIITPSYGTAEVLDTKIRYIPNHNFQGVDHIRYVATDGNSDANLSVITIYVVSKAQQNTPIGVVDYVYLDENRQVTIDVLANDLSNSDNNLSIKNTSNPSHGTISVENNKILYTPGANYRGEDSFTYTPYNDIFEGNMTTVNITVQTVNQAPHGLQDIISMYENNTIEIDVLSNDNDVDGDKIFIDRISQPQHGTTHIEDDKIIYTPTRNYHGEDSFTYTPHDGKSSGLNVLVRVTINDIDYDPIGVADSFEVVTQRAAYLDVLKNDINHDEDTLAIKSLTNPSHGTVSITSDGMIKYISNVGYTGGDNFTYVAVDETQNDSNMTSVSIDVLAIDANIPPIAYDDKIDIVSNTKNTLVSIFDNDVDGDGDQISLYSVTQPQHGNITSVEGGIEYTPNKDFIGTDSFRYRPSD